MSHLSPEATLAKWLDPDRIRLHAGEVTAQELRTVQAVVRAMLAEAKPAPGLHLAGNFRALLHRVARGLSEPMGGAVEQAAVLIDQQRLEIERLTEALERLAKWNKNVNGNGYELAEICEEAEKLVAERKTADGALEAPALPTTEELERLYETRHFGHPADFAADVLQRWGGWMPGLLGHGGALQKAVKLLREREGSSGAQESKA